MNLLLSSLCFLGATFIFAHAQKEADVSWEQWKLNYGKTYETPADEAIHETIWLDNLRYVTEHNAKPDATFRLGMNQLADLPPSGRPVLYSAEASDVTDRSANYRVRFVPASWDWRKQGAVTPVHNEGQTGDVVSIVVTEEIESYSFLHTKVLRELSIKETHACCVPEPIVSETTFTCIHTIGGLCLATAYHDTPGSCNNGTCTGYGKVNGGKAVPSGNEEDLKMAVLEVPVLALIDASHASFQQYEAGIYSDPACSTGHLDHAVQVVGFGTQAGQDFWIARNSWGVNWGMQGYILIARNKGNMCGIASGAFYPV